MTTKKTEKEISGIDPEYKRKIIALTSVLMPKAKIYLFGSRAVGNWGGGSDIDICLDTGEPIKRIDLAEVRDILNDINMSHKVDVVDFHSVYSGMQELILEEHILWKS